MLTLTRPITTIDCETSGLDPQHDAIFSFAAVKQFPDGHTEYCNTLIKPWKEIPAAVIALTGTTNAMVATERSFGQAARQIFDFLQDTDMCGFNIIGFDLPILWEELYRVGLDLDLSKTLIVDASIIYKRMEDRTLTNALKFYCGRDHDGAHGAPSDAIAAWDVFKAQVHGEPMYPLTISELEQDHRQRYAPLKGMTLADLHKFCAEDKDGSVKLDLAGILARGKDGIVRYTHKKVRGVAVKDDLGYGGWILRNDFSFQTKRILQQVMDEIQSQGQKGLF